MPQYRKLHVKVTQSFDVNEMPDDFHRLVWVLLPLGLDREGRGILNGSWVKSRIMPLREDVDAKQIMEAMTWFANRGMIKPYSVDGHEYFLVPTFHDYQGSTDKETESTLPGPESDLPPGGAWMKAEECRQAMEITPEKVKSYSGAAPEQVEQESRTDSDADSHANPDSQADADAVMRVRGRNHPASSLRECKKREGRKNRERPAATTATTSPPDPPKGKKFTPEHYPLIHPLARAFENASGMPAELPLFERAQEAFMAMYRAGVKPEDITRAVQELRAKQYVIIGAASVVTAAIACMGKRRKVPDERSERAAKYAVAGVNR